MKFDYQAARTAGYSDDEIADFLAKENNFDLGGALKSGYSSTDVIDFLSTPKGGKQDLPSDIKPSEGRSATPMGKADPRIVAPEDDRSIIQKVKDFVAPEYKSVMEGTTAPAKPLIESRGAPVSAETFNALKQRYDAATPQERTQLLGSKGVEGTVFKTIEDQYKQADKSIAKAPTLGVFDTRREARASNYIGQGLNAESADARAKVDAEQGATPTTFASLTSFEDDKNFFQKLADKTIAKPMDNSLGGAALETAGDAIRGIASGYTSISAGAWDALYLASESAGGMGNFSAWAREAGKAGRKSMANWDNAKDPNSVTKAVFESTTQMLMTAGLTGGMGNASIALSSGISAANAYGEARQAGKNHDQAAERAAVNFVAEFLGEKVALPQVQAVFGKFAGGGTAKEFAGAIGELAGKDLLGEEFTTTVEDLYDKFGRGGTRPNMTMADYIDDVVQTAKVTIGQSALIGGAGMATRQYHKATDTPEKAFAREMNASVAGSEFGMPADQVARDLLNPNTYDQRMVDPTQTSKVVNFTPADSSTKQAGLVDIEVPIPNAAPVLPPIDQTTEQEFGLDTLRTGEGNGTGGVPAITPTAGGVSGGNQLGGGMGVSGLDGSVAQTPSTNAGSTGLPTTNAQPPVAVGGGAEQPATSLTAQNNNAVVGQLVEPWFGRKGGGYSTEADAQQAISGRQRMFPTLDWRIEQMPNGKYMLGGYEVQPQETSNGAQATQTKQTESQILGATNQGMASGSQSPITGSASASVSGSSPIGVGQEGQLRAVGDSGQLQAGGAAVAVPAQGDTGQSDTAPIALTKKASAPISAIRLAIDDVKRNEGVEIATLPNKDLSEQQKATMLLATMHGNTVTYYETVSGDPNKSPNGLVVHRKHILIDAKSEDAPVAVAMHEISHALPEHIRTPLHQALRKLFKTGMEDQFSSEFKYSADQLDEEIPAMMTQAVMHNKQFWSDLRDAMGNHDFVELAKVILARLDSWIKGVRGTYGDAFADKYISDVAEARRLLVEAHAQAMNERASEESDQGVQSSNRSKPVYTHEVVDPRDGDKVMGQYQSAAAARRGADRLDNKYGAYRYKVREISSPESGIDIGAKLQERVDSDFNGAVAEYSQLKGAEGGRLLDTDLVRELSPEYRADRSRAHEVHEAASAMTQRMFEQRLAEQPQGIVAFMAGGGGAGKSSAQDLLKSKLSAAHTILDGTLSGYEKARRNVQMALDAGNRVVIAYIYREPVEALRNGVLTRAMSKGRTVTLDALVKGHAGSSEVVRKLEDEFGSNPRFKLYAIDNSKGAGQAQIVPIQSITPVIKSGLKERLQDATEQEFQAGRISKTVYDSTIKGYFEQGGGAETRPRVQEDVQGDRGNVQGRSGSVQQADTLSGPVSKDEAVVDGVHYSNRARNLVDIPTIDMRDLVGKKVFGIKADLTDAGRSYTGIDGSQLEFPIEMMGGPNYVRLPENAKTNVIWAVRGGAVLTKILKAVEASDYVLVHAMNGNSHLTNTTVSTAYLQTVEAYLRDGRISRDNLLALDEIVRSPDNKTSLPDFPGFESPEIYDYIDGLSFDQRGALAKLLEKKEAQAHGLPNLDRFRRETIDPDFVGYRQGDAMLVLKIDKKNPTVKLGEEGTKMHPSYPLGLRGKVVGKLSKGINYETIYRDYFENKVPTLKNKEEGAWYTFDRATPIQEITPEIAASVSAGAYKAIKTARQAEAALAMANGNWLVSGKTKADGGVSVQEFVDALRANDGAAALTMYDPKDVKAGIKDGSFRVYQLGNQGGDKGLKIFFGLKTGTPWYKDMIDGVGDNEVEVVSVTNNEMGATGVGIPAIITKAISEGATVLDAFAVKSKRFPDGFLPEMYAQFGFEEIGRIPFDPSYYDATQMADLKDFWSRGGWSEADGYPDVVVMRWKGNDEDRAAAVERYVRSGETSVSRGVPEYTRASAGDADQQRDSSRGAKGRARRGDVGQAQGNQGASDAAPVVRRAYDSISEIAELSDGDIRNLGLDPAEVQRLRSSLSGVVRSNRLAEPARGSGARSDESPRVGSFTGIHYGKTAGLSRLSGTSFGTGIKGAEQARLAEAGVDPRIKKRVYFYLTNNNADMPRPEIGLGQHVYRATLGNLYDPANASKAERQRVESNRKTAGANGFESAVLDAGFRGYVNREQGTAVVLNADVPVAYEGVADASKMRDRTITRVQQAIETRVEGGELVRKPTSDEMTGIIKARPALAKAAPSFKLEFGEARVKASEAEAADNALADAGASFQFGGVMASKRTSLAEDLAKQEEFLQQKAEEAGYKTIDEFVDNDYAGFVKAAEEWRQENPADVMMAKRVTPSSNFLLERDEMGNFKFKAGAMLYRSAADIANAVLEKTPFIGSLKPISKDLSLAMRRMKAEIEQAREKTAGVAAKLGKLGEDEREMISDVIEGELKAGIKPPKRILQLAASMQSIMSEQTSELVRLGMLSKDAAGRWDGKYLPRFYEQSLKKEATDWVKAAKALLGRKKTMQGIGGSSLKGRGKFENVPVDELESWLAQGWEERDPDFDPATDTEITIWRDYSKAEREKMGEIRDAMFRFVMGYMRSQKDIALGRLYENLASTVATKKVTEGYVQVPTSKVDGTYTRRYGKLAGMYVPQEVMDHLAAYDSNMEGDLLKMYRKALSMWKEGKTVLNPVAHANNVISNLTMAHFAGVSYWDAHKYLAAVREIVKGDKMVKEARAAGLFGGTVSQEELVSMLPDQLKVLAAKTESKVAKGVDTVWSALSFFMRKPLGVAYEAEDLYFRYLIYREARAKGVKPEDAVAYAQQFIFTYDDLPKGARTIRDAPIGIPFFSWTYKAIPVIARTALEYPWRFAAPAAVTYGVNAAMYAMAASLGGGDDEDWWEVIYRYITDPEFREKAKQLEQQERRYLPEWMKGNTALGTPKAIRLGTDDLTGLPIFLDASRIFPGGDLGDFTNNAGGVPLPAWLTPNNPVLTSMTAYLQNRDAFTGKEIVSNTLDTGGEKAAKWGEYAWRQFSPAIAPFSYHFDRTMNAIANATDTTIDLGLKEYTGVDKMGQPVQPKYAAMQTVGIKARPVDLDVSEQIEKSKREQMIREFDKQIRQINKLEGKDYYSTEKADKLREAVKEKRQRLKEGLTISGEEPQ